MSTPFALQFDLSSFEANSRQELLDLAKSAEAADRFEDMCACMRALVSSVASGEQLSEEERNLLSVAYKNVIGSRRAAWRTISALPESKNQNAYRATLVREVEAVAKDLLSLIADKGFASNGTRENQIFFVKLVADYYRYLAEVNKTQEYIDNASANYKTAHELSALELTAANPIRLGVSLNYSVCVYELLGDDKTACTIAKDAFDKAIAEIDQLSEDVYKDSTLILQLLRDNLTLWTGGKEEDAGDDA